MADLGFDEIISWAMIIKAKMKDRGLTRAKTKCPQCDAKNVVTLRGPKQHFHYGCGCGLRFME